MLAKQKNIKNAIATMILIAVISLAFSAGATSIPVVSTQAPIEKGLHIPLRMSLDSNGDIYVADPRSGGVIRLDQYGVVKQIIVTPSKATAVAVLNPLVSNISGGKLLVAMANHVSVYDQAGVEVAKLGSGNNEFSYAAGIAVDDSGLIYVTDVGASCVKIFASSGSFIKSFGAAGTPPATGVFRQPTGIAVFKVAGGQQQLAVVDSVNGNIQFFTTNGDYVNTVGVRTTMGGTLGPLSFTFPIGIAFENVAGVASRMYVLDSFQGYVKAIDVSATPTFLSNIGTYGFMPGQLVTPSDVVFDQTNKRLLVSNGMSNIVSYGIDGGSNPVDSTPPALTVSQSELFVDVSSVTLSGTVDVGATITSSASTTALTSAANFPSTSSWTIAVTGLVPGINTISVTAANQSGSSITKTVVINYTSPTVQLTVDSYPAVTGQTLVALSGVTEAGSTVTVYNGTTNVSGQAIVVDGIWTFTASLVEGANALSVTSAKAAKASAIKDLSIERDTQSPVINASLLDDGSSYSTPVLSVVGTVSDAHLASCAVNGVQAVLTNGRFNTAVALNLGDNTISITAVDQAGNATTDTRTISFNPALPQVTVQSPVDGLMTSNQDVVVAVKADVVSVTVNGKVAEPGPQFGVFTATVKLVPGLNTLRIDALDSFGRTVQEKRTVTYDAVAPIVIITTPSQDVAINNPGFTVSGSVSDDTAISSIHATVNGNDVPVVLTNNTFAVFVELTQENAHTVAITVTDSALNSSTAFRTLLYDVTPPAVTVDSVLSPLPVALSGTVELGATVVISDSGSLNVPALIRGAVWTADLAGVTFNSAALAVTATDAAGNKSVKSVTIPVPDGDVDDDGSVTIRDALRVIKLVVSNAHPSEYELNHGDVGPLLGGKRNPNGTLELVDGILILRKALGLSSWQ